MILANRRDANRIAQQQRWRERDSVAMGMGRKGFHRQSQLFPKAQSK
jgi:hypothetical protein